MKLLLFMRPALGSSLWGSPRSQALPNLIPSIHHSHNGHGECLLGQGSKTAAGAASASS